MHEFESFVYLDVEKTGSTFISRLLNHYSNETRLRQHHHRPLDADYDPTKFYFISVRDPLDCYLSLYSFGCQSQGKVRGQLRKRGHGDFYDGTTEGFEAWLHFMLKPKNAKMIKDGYHTMGDGRVAKLIGLQSYRYLRLAVPGADALLAGCASEADIRRIHEERRIPTFTVRYEWFAYDLVELVEGPLRHAIADVAEAVDHVRSAGPVNASNRIDAGKQDFKVRKRLIGQMREREWLLAETFGY